VSRWRVGAATRATAEWTAEQGLNLMSSTVLSEDTGVPFHRLQAAGLALRPATAASVHCAFGAAVRQMTSSRPLTFVVNYSLLK
jgi:hypothetical protein